MISSSEDQMKLFNTLSVCFIIQVVQCCQRHLDRRDQVGRRDFETTDLQNRLRFRGKRCNGTPSAILLVTLVPNDGLLCYALHYNIICRAVWVIFQTGKSHHLTICLSNWVCVGCHRHHCWHCLKTLRVKIISTQQTSRISQRPEHFVQN